jgi:hypothetical protein
LVTGTALLQEHEMGTVLVHEGMGLTQDGEMVVAQDAETCTVLVQKGETATVMSAGQVMLGFVVSLTVMVCVQVATLPQASTALYVRRIVYLFGQVWLVITSPTKVTVGVLQASETVTDATLAGGTFDGHWTVTFAGQVMLGAVVSAVQV